MAKVFDLLSEVHESPNRNTFDLTHKRHMTGKAGVIYPFLVQPVVPTDSFEIDTGIGINLMPMWYPTQSNMRFIVHYFYVPNRLLMKDWKNTIQGLEEHELPYHNLPSTWYKTGSLADFLGIPTNFVIPADQTFNFSHPTYFNLVTYEEPLSPNEVGVSLLSRTNLPLGQSLGIYCDHNDATKNGDDIKTATGILLNEPLAHMKLDNSSYLKLPFTTANLNNVTLSMHAYIVDGPETIDYTNLELDAFTFANFHVSQSTQIKTAMGQPYLLLSRSDIEAFNAAVSSCKFPRLIFFAYAPAQYSINFGAQSSYIVPKGEVMEVSKYPNYNPYYGTDHTNTDAVKIRSFAARAYEMVYNSYYRNQHGNQPFVVNGETKYNEYLPTDASGADTTPYALHERNWELDAYTSCMPSPQQGDAPIISVNSVGTMRIQDADGTTSTIQLRDLDGEAGLEVRSADIANPQHAVLATRLTTTGMTISDFRQGNALTRFLEQSLRSGYRYADFIFGHFGKSPSHQELDMPLFLGGFTQNVDVNKISNVTASSDAPLGAFAGTGSGFGVSTHGIKHYFDDYGILLGVMMLVPDPAYSQVLPKHFTYTDRLDWYFPEFGQLGLQSVKYEELCPIQSHMEYANGSSSKLLTDTFGYQRPNHEYIWLPDTLHGLFRTSLNGSVINRRFGARPVLGDEFLRIKPDEVNDIFSVVEENEDIFIGQIVCKITATRPIARVVVPTLGR